MNSPAQFDELKHLLAQRVGLSIPPDAQARFISTLQERAALLGYPTLKEYRTFLVGNKATVEWEAIVRAFTSVETFFFRDHGQFDLLRMRLLPEMIARQSNDKTLRLWSAGCASGEEAYSLAMLVDMLLPESSNWNVFVLGTDIDSVSIEKARQGRYGKWSFRMFPAAFQQRYFHPENNEWVMDERIRHMVTFRVGNLVSETFPNIVSHQHKMDLILCRNVFLYFDPAAVLNVATKFAATLVEEGYLMTAHTELIGHRVPGLESRLFAEGVVYQRHEQLPACEPPQPVPAITAAQISPSLTIPGGEARKRKIHIQETQISPQEHNHAIELCASARTRADRGEYELAERMCRDALVTDPLDAAPYFLLAQLAQIKGDFNQAKDCLNKTLYLDHHCVVAYLELAALHERDGNMSQAQTLRQTALRIVRAMPENQQIEQYERTAGELAQWLEQCNSNYRTGNKKMRIDQC